MRINNYFSTSIWFEKKPEFLKSLNSFTNEYIKEAKNYPEIKKYIKKFGDFGISYRSKSLVLENNFLDFRNYVSQKSLEYLDFQGYAIENYELIFSDMWAQQFSKKGGGHHYAPSNNNQHVSGFYFLKCSEKTSYPIFYDPRPVCKFTRLKMKSNSNNSVLHFKPEPGTILIFPSYLEHEYAVDHGQDTFKFIRWNMQAVPKEVIKDVI
jgi:hypothetical protein